MGESTIYTLLRLLARLAATANIRQGRETVLPFPNYFKRRRCHGNPFAKNLGSPNDKSSVDGSLPRAFFSGFRERRLENGG